MPALTDKITDFLAQKTIAIVGVSRQEKGNPANLVYAKLRDKSCRVLAVNPNATQFDGEPCYPNVKSLPEKADAVFINTKPDVAEQILRECAEAGIQRVWLHRSFGAGSVSANAEALAAQLGLTVIAGACPMMFCEPVDLPHKCFRWLIKVTGKMPA